MDDFGADLRELLKLGSEDEVESIPTIDVDEIDANAGMLEFRKYVDDKTARPNDAELKTWYELLQLGGLVHVGSGRYIAAHKKQLSHDLECNAIKLRPHLDDGEGPRTPKERRRRATTGSSVRPSEARISEPPQDASPFNWHEMEQHLDEISVVQLERARGQNFYHLQDLEEEPRPDSFGQELFDDSEFQEVPEIREHLEHDRSPEDIPHISPPVEDIPSLPESIIQLPPSVSPPSARPAPLPRRPRTTRHQRIIDENANRVALSFWLESTIDRCLYADIDFHHDLPMNSFEEQFFSCVFSEPVEMQAESLPVDVLVIPQIEVMSPDFSPLPEVHEPETAESPHAVPEEEVVAVMPSDLQELEMHILGMGRTRAEPTHMFRIDDFIIGPVTALKRVSVMRCVLQLHDECKLTMIPTDDLNFYIVFDQGDHSDEE